MTIATLTATETAQVSGALLGRLGGLTSLLAVPAIPALPAVPNLASLAQSANFSMAFQGSFMGAAFGGQAGTGGSAITFVLPGVDALLGLIPVL